MNLCMKFMFQDTLGQEELKIIQGLTKPKYFIPVHGEQKHLQKHAELAYQMGIPKENVFIGNIGNVIELNRDYMKQLPDGSRWSGTC